MKNRWDDVIAEPMAADDLALRVYSSRLLGQEKTLVLHGGGNTSVKTQQRNLWGETQDVLCVKGSGWDLESIETAGFPAVKLEVLRKLASLDHLSDADMVREQRAAMLDPGAPNPSVEAILHALIPFKFVDHTHADAVVTISNSPKGEQVLKNLLGEQILYIPYVMPGFVLAKKVALTTAGIDWNKFHGMVLMNHGVFSFADEAKTCYSRMIDIVSKAETYLEQQAGVSVTTNTLTTPTAPAADLESLCQLRAAVSRWRGKPVLARLHQSPLVMHFVAQPRLKDMVSRGPLTPDHVIRTKRIPVTLDPQALEASINYYAADYQAYFTRQQQRNKASLTCLDPAPRWAVWPGIGCVSFGDTLKAADVITDISRHTLKAILRAESLGGWQALSEDDIFDMEYWELEQAKLGKSHHTPSFQGKVVLISGAANGIGRACVEHFAAQGAAVIALDIIPGIKSQFSNRQILGLPCDVTDDNALRLAVQQGVRFFGGLDILVCNAGIFPPSAKLQEMSKDTWDNSLNINLTSHQRLLQLAIPYLRHGIGANVIMVASKNVPAPGPGAAAYSVAKAGLTQLARVAALELAPLGIRVNVIHPNAVFDTALWTDAALEQRAAHYGLSVHDYKTNNLLKTEVRSTDVAHLIATVAGPAFAKTTGAQIPIDGGNERVI